MPGRKLLCKLQNKQTKITLDRSKMLARNCVHSKLIIDLRLVPIWSIVSFYIYWEKRICKAAHFFHPLGIVLFDSISYVLNEGALIHNADVSSKLFIERNWSAPPMVFMTKVRSDRLRYPTYCLYILSAE